MILPTEPEGPPPAPPGRPDGLGAADDAVLRSAAWALASFAIGREPAPDLFFRRAYALGVSDALTAQPPSGSFADELAQEAYRRGHLCGRMIRTGRPA